MSKSQKTHDDHFIIKQKNEESLKSYIEWFNVKFINISKYYDNVAVLAFMLGLQRGTKVKEDLTIMPPQNLEEILS